jgi:hypothetical protein
MGSNSTPPVTTGYKGPSSNETNLVPYLRLRGITTVPNFVFPDLAILPMPSAWLNQKITLEIKASNITHYTFSASPAGSQSQMQDIGFAPGLGLTWGFTGMFPILYLPQDEKKTMLKLWQIRCTSWCLCNYKWGSWGIQDLCV